MTLFAGGSTGPWRIVRNEAVVGDRLVEVARLGVHEGEAAPPAVWLLRGVASYERYVHREEHARLELASPPLGRKEATHAALIPILKSDDWWALPQDERREIFEERSHHIESGLDHLPAVARRLYHSRDLDEPFDFLTWFEYAPEHAGAFENLVDKLRSSEEWTYVAREVDLRLVRSAGDAPDPAR